MSFLIFFYRIPKKDGKDEKPKIHSGSSLQKPSSNDSKSSGYSNSYNHSYNKKPNPKDQPRPYGASNVKKKSFGEALFQATEQKKFNVLDVMSSMKNLNNKPKDDHFSSKKPKEGENKPPEQRLPVQDNRPPARTPSPEDQDKDPEIERLLSKYVRDRAGRELKALTVRNEGTLQVFKCQICRVQVDGKPNLMKHLSGQRHASHKRDYQDVHHHRRSEHSQQTHRQQPSHNRPRTPPGQNHWQRYERHERVEAPWTFSPSEVVDDVPHHDDNASDEYRPNSPMDFGGDDHYDPPSPAGNVPTVPSLPSLPSTVPSLPTPVPALPKPVPSIQPTQTLNPTAFGIGPSSVPNPALFGNSMNNPPPIIPGLDFAPQDGQFPGNPMMNFDVPPPNFDVPPPAPVQREPSFDEDNLFPNPPEKIYSDDENQPSPAVSPVPAPIPEPFVPDQFRASPVNFDFNPMPVPPPVQEVPSPVPAPVPPPTANVSPPVSPPKPVPAPSKTLTLKELKKLPKSMSFEDRVIRGLESQKNQDWQRAREAREKVNKTNDENEAYVPPGMSSDEDEEYVPAGLEKSPIAETGDQTPVYDAKTDKPAVSSPVNEFKIDTTKSFLDPPPKKGGLKLKPMGSLMAKPEDSKPTEKVEKPPEKTPAPPPPPEKPAKKATEKPKKAKLGSFFDKVIKSLQKSGGGPSMQLPSMNMNEDDTNPGEASDYQPPLPPLPNLPPPPLPVEPKPSTEFDPSSILDDDTVLSIVSELDKDMAEEEKLSKAKEKLAQILQKKMNQNRAGALPPPMPPIPDHPRAKAGPRSRMQVQPEVAYRAGPRSRLQSLNPNLLAAPPPPPPEDPSPRSGGPRGVPTDDEISNFMSQWTRPSEEPVEQPQYSSALAKLRAKKAAKNAANKKPVPLMDVNTDQMVLDQAPYFEYDQFKNRAAEIEGKFTRRSLEAWKNIHHRRWDDLMKDMFAELWVSQFLLFLSPLKQSQKSERKCWRIVDIIIELNFQRQTFNFLISFLLQVSL